MGGATLDAVTHKMNGSVLLFECANEAECRALVDSDPYVTGKVWENVEIQPFLVARIAGSKGN